MKTDESGKELRELSAFEEDREDTLLSLSDEQLDKTQCATVRVSKMYNLRNRYYKKFKGHYIQLTVRNLNTLPFSHSCALRGLS